MLNVLFIYKMKNNVKNVWDLIYEFITHQLNASEKSFKNKS